MAPVSSLWAEQAWLPGGWRGDVLLEVDAHGRWSRISPDTAAPPGAERLAGPALPALVNAHGHAFQRAFAGLAERREGAHDDFWSWRDRMYGAALRITPAQLRAVATQLYVELLHGGYTQVCEFHYLQDDEALAEALAAAARDAGIGLTLLPVVYERAGFDRPALRDDQRRFACDADTAWRRCAALNARGAPGLAAGVALHSLRAASPAAVARLRTLAAGFAGPIHIHVAEQVQEVDDCLAATGRRPIEWLLAEGVLDARWQLVHATHATPEEIAGVARSGAGMVLCPSTEANLGDGLPDLPRWLDAGVPVSVGSDSHVGRDWREELRWLDYGQRLLRRARNVAAAPQHGQPSTAARLFDRVCEGGGAAAGERAWGLVPGARADLLVADPGDPALAGLPPLQALDALVFSSPARPWRDVCVGGRFAVRAGRHALDEAARDGFADALRVLWAPRGR